MAFDRLVRAVDQWAEVRKRMDVFAQIGPADYIPQHIEFEHFIDPPEFRRRVSEADAIVAHAGMGSIITALELGKPIIVMPRRGDLKETRNDHQVATAKRFLAQGRIAVAFDEAELLQKLDQIEAIRGGQRISTEASPDLISTLKAFLRGEIDNSNIRTRQPTAETPIQS